MSMQTVVHRLTVAVVVGSVLLSLGCAAQGDKLRAEFEDAYAGWKQYCEELGPEPDAMKYVDCPYYRQIVAMGPAALPFIVEQRRSDAGFHWVGWAWADIAGIVPAPKVNPWAGESITVRGALR